MKTGAAIGVIGGVVALAAVGVFAWDEIEKDKCKGKWEGLPPFGKGCVGDNGLPAPTNFQITVGASDGKGNYTCTASWDAVTGATSYQLTINGQQVYTGPLTSYTFQAAASTTLDGSVAACN